MGDIKAPAVDCGRGQARVACAVEIVVWAAQTKMGIWGSYGASA